MSRSCARSRNCAGCQRSSKDRTREPDGRHLLGGDQLCRRAVQRATSDRRTNEVRDSAFRSGLQHFLDLHDIVVQGSEHSCRAKSGRRNLRSQNRRTISSAVPLDSRFDDSSHRVPARKASGSTLQNIRSPDVPWYPQPKQRAERRHQVDLVDDFVKLERVCEGGRRRESRRWLIGGRDEEQCLRERDVSATPAQQRKSTHGSYFSLGRATMVSHLRELSAASKQD